MQKKIFFLTVFTVSFLYKSVYAQEIIDTPIEHYIRLKPNKDYVGVSVTGRVIGTNLEDITGAMVLNIRTDEKTVTDSRGIFHINAAKGDSISVKVSQYSREIHIVKNPKDNQNIILIKRKTENLPADHTEPEYKKALKEDNELYRILEKDAKLEGKWNY